MLTHTCTHMHWCKHMHAVIYFHTPTCSHSFACSHMHIDSQCLRIQSHACTCSQTSPYTQMHSQTQPAYTHTYTHTHSCISTLILTHTITITHAQSCLNSVIHTCTHTIRLHKPNLHPSVACLSRLAQAWPHLMAAHCSLFSFLVLFIFLSHNEHIWRRIYFHHIWKHTSPRP